VDGGHPALLPCAGRSGARAAQAEAV